MSSRGASRRHEVTLPDPVDRIDRALAAELPLSRTQIQAAISAGRVAINGVVVTRSSEAVPAGAVVTLDPLPKREPSFEPSDIPIEVLYEDADCLVVDKPAGLVVHPAPGHPHDTLVNALLYHRPQIAGVGDERKAGLVHRLDKDTSGCLLVAKNDPAHRSLSEQFARRTVDKTYWVFTWGHLPEEEGVFEAAIGRSARDRQRMSTRTRKGRPARTHYRVLERYPLADWLEVGLETGRTHQIRVHLSEAGHPVIMDSRYGGGAARSRGFHGPQLAWARQVVKSIDRQALHACKLAFDQPTNDQRITVESALPDDLEKLHQVLRQQGGW